MDRKSWLKVAAWLSFSMAACQAVISVWSRVCRLTSYRDVPLHATPLYSILWNVVVALVVSRLWVIGAPLHLIAGAFAIVSGIGRFVEEGYRGEPQTPCKWGLRLYQWIAVGSVVVGILVTALGSSAAAPSATWNWGFVIPAAAAGAVVTAAFGLDFPESSRRFARLA